MRRSLIGVRSGPIPNTVRVAIFIALLAVGAVLAVLPQTRPPSTGGIGLVIHGLAFGALTFAAICFFGRPWFSAALVLGYSALIEALQSLVPYRHASLLDIAANAVGVSLVLAAVLGLRRWRRRRWEAD